jgi:hypothetical protein
VIYITVPYECRWNICWSWLGGFEIYTITGPGKPMTFGEVKAPPFKGVKNLQSYKARDEHGNEVSIAFNDQNMFYAG